MYDRFTHKSRTGRGKISRSLREEVFARDNYTCQFCGASPSLEKLTIDHLIPLSHGGLDEMVNFVTSCQSCNTRKANQPLDRFARGIQVPLEQLPIHGDPVVGNPNIPIQIRLLRKRIIEQARSTGRILKGTAAQKK